MSDGASPERGSARDAHTCSFSVSIGQPVVTSLMFFGKYRVPVDMRAFPEHSMFTLGATATMFGVSKKTIRNEICEKRALLSPAIYRGGRRLLTMEDIDVLRRVFAVAVKH